MSYEVYIDVTHHPRDRDDTGVEERKDSHASRWVTFSDEPTDKERAAAVVAALREYADILVSEYELDLRVSEDNNQ